ncbi:hypothetical protein [Streptomyces sp. NK08204]|uniref:hypothetical protein n=1 Tax=Streptomyces sp. NK08204 TaxID=2873260 RepID=UPI001CED11F1|nr:hypothetical protein [Streptomyces sp. NK08204]
MTPSLVNLLPGGELIAVAAAAGERGPIKAHSEYGRLVRMGRVAGRAAAGAARRTVAGP